MVDSVIALASTAAVFSRRISDFVGRYGHHQGCQMVCFQTKNPNLGKFWRVLLWKILVYFMTIWPILRPLELFYGLLVYFGVIWYIFPHFGILDQEKSGNPEHHGAKSVVTKTTGLHYVCMHVCRCLWTIYFGHFQGQSAAYG
jgi:hypothetical protein